MPRFLIEVAYTPEAWAAQLENPQNRMDVLKPFFDSVGAKVETAYFAFGESDLIMIVSAPDNVSVAALSISASAGGALKSVKTTPLMAVEEGLEALRKGARARAAFVAPGKNLSGAVRN